MSAALPVPRCPGSADEQKERVPSPSRRHRFGRVAGVAAVLAAGALGLSACGGSSAPTASSSSSSSTAAAKETVTIKNFAFHPANFTVNPGATVTVTNKDSVTHTFTADDGKFNTGDIGPGQTKTITAPAKAGAYPYMCQIHQFMTGTLTVK